MAFNCYRRPPEPWQSRTSLPLATPALGFSMITEVPNPIRMFSFRDHGPMPLTEAARAGWPTGQSPPALAGFGLPPSYHFPPLEPDKSGAKRAINDTKTKSDTKLRELCGSWRAPLECRGGSLWSVP